MMSDDQAWCDVCGQSWQPELRGVSGFHLAARAETPAPAKVLSREVTQWTQWERDCAQKELGVRVGGVAATLDAIIQAARAGDRDVYALAHQLEAAQKELAEIVSVLCR